MRLFVGIQMPKEIRDRLKAISFGLAGARWITPDNLHATLRFIGDLDGPSVDDVDTALGGVHEPGFSLTLNGVGQFGRGHMSHTVWAGIKTQPALVHLHDKIESASVRAGLDADRRKFTPHVTLARLKKTPEHEIADWAQSIGDLKIGPFQVDSFQLFRSHLGHGPAHYQVLSEYALEPELV